ncbi:zinc finger protein OZF-like [Cylas formicarius]|uniref:zinc finger protein OZF-like n=1 Tax=Cylas formicarius TaxID=197179 RepID=UPI0029584C0D|nr:zinc finger protein OZF-like [Cylas formicarius]
MSCKYLLDTLDGTKPDSVLASSVVDQLNASDSDLLNLLSTEEECTALLNNIATDQQFDTLINESDFVANTVIEPLNHEPEKETFRCDQCDRICSTKKLLRKHLEIHTRERKIPCDECGKLFRFRYEVKAHARSHEKPTLQCDVCSKMFIHKSHLTVHRRKHLNEYVAFCEECNIGFVSKRDHAKHVSTRHEKARLICETCGASLSTTSALKEHRVTHRPGYGKERPHGCAVCGKRYITPRNLKSHMIVHSRVKPYVCRICGKSVSSKSILETHVKMHTGVKDFVCDVCGKGFASKEYLAIHQRIHDGNKPFECAVCGKRFTQKTSLTVHSRYHTGKRPYRCECGKNFTTKSHLMTHYKTHDVGGVDIDYISYPIHESLQAL